MRGGSSAKARNGNAVLAQLHRELVPLDEAAAAAYQIVSEERAHVRDPAMLQEVRRLVAIALSTVAPVLRQQDGRAFRLSEAEIHERLYAPRGNDASFESLCMRRIDLVRAVETLKEAHLAFGRKDVLDALKRR